jgi:PQQ-dependent catabolism-associated CXXCW motif protein
MRAPGLLIAFAALACAAHAAPPADPPPFDAEGYRSARYRSPVRADPAPAAAITLEAALALAPGRDALFIDVTPVEGGVRDPVSGAWTLSAAHLTIPGALWHPETGRAPVDPALWQALEAAIREARRSAAGQPVILFCRIDCWMSWNAARRLARGGVGGIRWLAEGTDGWQASGRSLAVAAPVTVPASQPEQQEN